MTWIDQNLDAYRVIAEILNDLRPLVRQRLEATFGKSWFSKGIPEETFDRLIRDKEREIAIDWYENRYQEVLNYAVFPDFFEIVTANAELFKPILDLAPSQSLLHTRFLELEVMRAKIGHAREISEAEITFLTTFHLRFRKSVQELSATSTELDASAGVGELAAADSSDADDELEKEIEVAVDNLEPHDPSSTNGSRDRGDDEDALAAGSDDLETQATEPSPAGASTDRPPLRLATPMTTSHQQPTNPSEETGSEVEPGPKPAPIEDEDTAVRETASEQVQRAMENEDDLAVLRRLYREVTGIAEGIWTTAAHPSTAVWDRVSTHPWYEKNFSKLELRPLSDFYEIISQVRSRRQNGAAKAEIQSFLNESNFATVLLALRDMFQKNKI